MSVYSRIRRFVRLQRLSIRALIDMDLTHPCHPSELCGCDARYSAGSYEGFDNEIGHYLDCAWYKRMCRKCHGTGWCEECGGDGTSPQTTEPPGQSHDDDVRTMWHRLLSQSTALLTTLEVRFMTECERGEMEKARQTMKEMKTGVCALNTTCPKCAAGLKLSPSPLFRSSSPWRWMCESCGYDSSEGQT